MKLQISIKAKDAIERFLLAGGTIKATEIFHMSLGGSEECATPPDLPTKRRNPVGAYVDGKAVVCGGQTSNVIDAEKQTF